MDLNWIQLICFLIAALFAGVALTFKLLFALAKHPDSGGVEGCFVKLFLLIPLSGVILFLLVALAAQS